MKRPFARGQIILIALVFFAVFVMVAAAFVSLLTTSERAERTRIAQAQALRLAEAGIDKAVYQLNLSASYTGETATALGSGSFTTVVTTVDSTTKLVSSTGTSGTVTRTVHAKISIDNSVVSFHYGVQAGDGGFTLANSSEIIGNVFSTGPVIGTTGNYIRGSVVSTGSSGLVYGVHATSTVFAHTIGGASQATTIDGDAYYASTITNSTVAGTLRPGSADQSPVALPISDAQIGAWETDAAAGGTISSCDGSGDYTISSTQTIGPVKILCNLVIKSSSGIVTINGAVWVTGNITFKTGPTMQMAPSLGSTNVPVIADNPANQTGSGLIDVGNTTQFFGSGAVGSFVFLISQNKSAEQGGSNVALSLAQGASALVAYASHGLASLSQSVNVKEVTAYKIALYNTASVTYDTGLPTTVFETGPGGSWVFVPGSYGIEP
jgi:Tfp pilus assembly protein PilX